MQARYLWVTAGCILCVIIIAAFLTGSEPAQAQVDGPLPTGEPPRPGDRRVEAAVLEAVQEQGRADYVIVMAEQADLSRAYTLTDWDERGRFVYATLKEFAAQSQAGVLWQLERFGVKYKSYIAGNEIYVYQGNSNSLNAVLDLEGVAFVRAPEEVRLSFPWTARLVPVGPSVPQPQVEPLASVTWGLQDTHALQFWSTFGVKGAGVTVANLDTGVQYSHPALSGSYKCRGDPGSSNCWFDPTGVCSAGLPCDNNGHGTHTMGTMLSSDNPALAYTAGMAPDADWIACKACASNQCADAALLACADWLLAPGGDPSNRPDIVNNSWGDTTGGNTWYLNRVNAWRAAGIFPAFSAGNTGSSCTTLGSPGDYQASFSAAAHSTTRAVAGFSSRGPGAFGDTPYTKPNLSAPGVSIISTYLGSDWASSSGTSMASPHVAGAVALLWSLDPTLRGDIDTTFQILQNTADPAPGGACGVPASGQGDYTYGYGYLNVLEAGILVDTGGTLSGRITNASAGAGIQGASLVASIGDTIVREGIAESNGDYSLLLPSGVYSLTVSRYGYLPRTIHGIRIFEDNTTIRDVSLDPRSAAVVSGSVRDGSGLGGPVFARVSYYAEGETVQATTNSSGFYSLDLFQGQVYNVRVVAITWDYLEIQETVNVDSAGQTRNYALLVNPATCGASGYLRIGGVSESFSTGELPPGWEILDYAGNGEVWRFDDPGFQGNNTGSSGGFAVIDSDFYGPDGSQDTALITPVMSFVDADAVQLNFNAHYRYYSGGVPGEVADVDISLDNGQTWTNLWKKTGADFTGPVSINLTGRAAGKTGVRVRFHYYNGEFDWWWQVDNVSVTPGSSCILTGSFLYLPVVGSGE